MLAILVAEYSLSNIFKENENCWRVPRADRFALLVDAANYYSALRSSMLKAESAIFVVGWDVDSRIRLAGEADPDDSAPEQLKEFLCYLSERRPSLRVHVLMWDFSVLYALEREPMPALNLAWATPKNVEICLDDIVPLGASHHQKIVIIDGKVAFCGGLDLAACRWDTREHKADNPQRVDPNGKPYKPFHNMHSVVDGDAAKALTELVAERWENAACRKPKLEPSSGDPWPDGVEPDFVDHDVAISRTIAPLNQRSGVYEVEQMYLDLVSSATSMIYLENQFLTADSVAKAMYKALRDNPDLEIIMVSSRDPHGFLEAHSMATGRARFMSYLMGDENIRSRVRLVYPRVDDGTEQGQDVLVHAKVMVVDNAYLRIGSSNLNNRSMGTDGECDLVITADDDGDRAKIAEIRNDLIGEHLGLSADDVAAGIDEHGGLRHLIDARAEEPRTLGITDYETDVHEGLSKAFESVADPERPSDASQFIGDMMSARPAGTRISGKVIAGGAIVLAVLLISIWQYSPLADFTDPERLKSVLMGLRGDPWAYLIVPLAFVLGSAVVFPITAMIAATAIVFPPLSAFLIALGGSLLGAAVNYALGLALGRSVLRQVMGKRLNKISRALGKRGVLTIITLRIVPVAPFTLINLVAGASHIKFFEFVIGSLIGLLPGVATMTLVGNRLFELLQDPKPMDIMWLVLALCAWFGIGFVAQKVIMKIRQRFADQRSG